MYKNLREFHILLFYVDGNSVLKHSWLKLVPPRKSDMFTVWIFISL